MMNKNDIYAFLSKYYRTGIYDGKTCLYSKRGIPFSVFSFNGAFGIEYLDTREDGDLFYPEDFDTPVDLLNAMKREVDEAE